MLNDWVAQEEQEVLTAFRRLQENGYGRLEVIIREGHVETMHETLTTKPYRKEDKLLTKV